MNKPVPNKRIDQIWNEVDDSFDVYRNRLNELGIEQAKTVVQILSAIDGYLQGNDFDYVTPAYTVAANLIRNKPGHAMIWNWIRECVKKYPDERWKQALIITIIEPATEMPVFSDDIPELIKFLEDETTTEALFVAYDHDDFPKNLLNDYFQFCEWEQARGRKAIAFPYDGLATYMEDRLDEI